jgi:hypothetical protein
MSREGPRTILRRVLDHVRRGEPWSCSNIEGIAEKDRHAVEARLKEKFELWADSWVIPELEHLLGKFDKRKKHGSE